MGKPILIYGDSKDYFLITGIAPAAHGDNRTGRIFTGDSSGDWLAKSLFETRFESKSTSISRNDGYFLKEACVTAVVKCVHHKIFHRIQRYQIILNICKQK